MLRKALLLGWLAGFLWMLPSTGWCQDLKIGVLANRGPAAAIKEWKATADYLSAKTGKTFAILPLDYDQFVDWTKEKRIDFVLANSAMYAELNKLYGIQAIATQINQHKNQPMDKFGSLILVKQDSPIKNLAGFKGTDFACASRSAFGGWLMTARLFAENGVNPGKDLKTLKELRTHDNVVWAVLNGAVAGGSIRTGVLEDMVQEGKVKMSDFRIVHQLDDGFPLLHSTQVYPEYPLAACQQVPADFRRMVSKALVEMRPTDPAAVNAGIAGWREPLDYKPVEECLIAIKYGAFANLAQAAPAPPTSKVEEKRTESSAGSAALAPAGTTEEKPQAKPVRRSVRRSVQPEQNF
jgi:two-component system, LuxR family, sensor histidine kinase TtrS